MYKYLPMSAASKMTLALFIAMSSALAACSNGELALDDTYAPAAYYEQYPIEVVKGTVKMEVPARDGTLQPRQINAVTGFSLSAVSSRSSKIAILRPSGGGASGKVAREIYQLMVRNGIAPTMIVQKTYPGPSKGPVQLSFVRSVAVTRECGDWSADLASTSKNEPSPNLGCSIQNNIAAMVANPDDLLVPEPMAPAMAGARESATRAYAFY